MSARKALDMGSAYRQKARGAKDALLFTRSQITL